MKICVFQSLYGEVSTDLKDVDPSQDPSYYKSPHSFENRWLKKDTAKAQIDAAVSEGFDLYFNFLWGQHEDEVAGIEAVRYLESQGIPFIGMPSRILERSKLDFYADAEKAGIRVPKVGRSNFPLFVKPAKRCASMSINARSLCQNKDELEKQITWIEQELEHGRKIAAAAGILPDPADLGDIVIQEYIEGQDYSCTVLEFNETLVALAPTRYCYPPGIPSKGRFLHWDLKFNPELHVKLFRRAENPTLFDKMQAIAVKAFKANRMEGGAWGNVDFRVKHDDGELVVMEVNPMPAVFLPPGEHEWEDLVIRESLPGSHRALISILIATKSFQARTHHARTGKVVERYDRFANQYDELVGARSQLPDVMGKIVAEHNFEGSILELGSGTGQFGKLVKNHRHAQHPLVGVEPSTGMRSICNESCPGLYDQVHPKMMQDIIMSLPSFDHIVAVDSMHFLDHDTFILVLCRAFQLAQHSVTLCLAEFTDEYNKALIECAESNMQSFNNVPEVDSFGVPLGWRLAVRERHFAWTSPHTQEKIFATVYRFERQDERVAKEQASNATARALKRSGLMSFVSSFWR